MPKQTVESRLYLPGERAETAGVYRAAHYQHRRPHELTINEGEVFPSCRTCGELVRYTLVAAAESGLFFADLSEMRPAVLVADQERTGAHALLEMLTRQGYEVEFVQTGRLARRLLEHSEYDAVITDLDLERAGAGLEIAKFAKSRHPFPLVFIYASEPTPDMLQAMRKLRVDYCAIEPFNPQEIGSALSRIISRRQAVEALRV